MIVRIENLRRMELHGVCRICADVNGTEVWYESGDADLLAAPEVFASAFLVPAMVRGGGLCVEGAVSTVWKSNVQQLMELFSRWWGYSIVEIHVDAAPQPPAGTGRNALFFTGGVDSFYSLLKENCSVNDLVYVQGFDASLDDGHRLEQIRTHLDAVAGAAGRNLVTVRTNLRLHPLVLQAGWGHVHGGALASVAHSLSGVSSAVVSSSYSRMAELPWGSHWKSDPLWSSERLQVVHLGDQVLRNDKLEAIAGDPLVQRHLRVCWKNLTDELNCCQCEKCVRTMLLLQACGTLDSFGTFPFRDQLPRMIRRVRYVLTGLLPIYEDFLGRGLPPDSEKALRGLLRRSRARLFRKSMERRLNPWRRTDAT